MFSHNKIEIFEKKMPSSWCAHDLTRDRGLRSKALQKVWSS